MLVVICRLWIFCVTDSMCCRVRMLRALLIQQLFGGIYVSLQP